MARTKKPEEGKRVSVYDAWTDSWLDGTVDLLMSDQFSWETDNGQRFITRYDGTWKDNESR